MTHSEAPRLERRSRIGIRKVAGYVCDLAGHIVKDPNLRVQEAIELVFKKFRELESIHQTSVVS
ncbi:MAG: hypothetical protein M3436_11225 [Pseudomonadota bacterium]|nr:hypothetical protein [Pseudomonadota bacterium]